MKKYQAVAFLLSTAMTVSSVAPVFGASNDIFGHWAEFTITKWQNEGRIGGYEDGTFKPDRAITRAEFVRLLNSAAPTAFTSSASINFSDVKESDWFYADVAKVVGGRVASGFEDGTFRPGETVTRMQAAVFICNAKGLTPNEASANNFTDAASIPAWAKGAVGAAVAAGLLNSAAPTAFTSSASINFSDVKESDWFYADVAKVVGGRVASGFEDGTFRPGETVTRMQAAVFICNAKGLTPNEASANNFTDAASIPAWAKGAVGAAVAAGYLSGYPDGSFGGSKGMTRAEAVSTLDRVLGGGSTTTTPSGEIDTTDRDNTSTEDNRTAAAGNMVWTSGGGGGGSSKGSSSSSSSDKDKKTHNVTIRSQSDADDYEGKTLTGTTTIYPDNGLKLNDIRFKGDVDIKVQSDAVVASAYADSDVAVAAAYTAKINIFFEGKTSVSGIITVVENNVPSSQVVIKQALQEN
ncbi:S-layer homology domain-containing protein [Clostridium sp. MD294]|uniref:S-layer homology domain-containing protein n=1 Tax=Clostridium sp. MD294 TaxID=97138 RepID=UPI00138F6B67|nr:S-layer homology domain-containing protein [Clostridium sp. MD294]NDO45666.1 S-layer homology domain-containing protein [Clostridium sp. MD294]